MDTLVSLAGRFPLPGLVRDLHPLDDTHAGQTKKVPKYYTSGLYLILHLKNAVRTGLEPVTPCVTGMYSNQLN